MCAKHVTQPIFIYNSLRIIVFRSWLPQAKMDVDGLIGGPSVASTGTGSLVESPRSVTTAVSCVGETTAAPSGSESTVASCVGEPTAAPIGSGPMVESPPIEWTAASCVGGPTAAPTGSGPMVVSTGSGPTAASTGSGTYGCITGYWTYGGITSE